MSALHAVLESALDTSSADPRSSLGLARIVASGTVVLGFGIALMVRECARVWLKQPSERRGGWT